MSNNVLKKTIDNNLVTLFGTAEFLLPIPNQI